MKNYVTWWKEILIILVLLVGVFFLVKYLAENTSNFNTYTEPTIIESKPVTKTRCDITGFMASSIIAEEAANGYRFNGRVSTLLCGNNGLSFSL